VAVDPEMPHLIVMMLVPLVPLTCLALVLWLDRLEETLDRDVDRRRSAASRSQSQLEASLAGAPSSAPVVAADASLGGSTNR
jgi:hypothetical protein